MFKLIKDKTTISISNDMVNSLQATSDGLVLTTRDKTEIRMYFTMTPAIQAIISMADNNLHKELVIDIDAALAGKMDKVMKIGPATSK